MNTMTLYHISKIDLGDQVMVTPTIPVYPAFGENDTIPRICACASVIGCLRAIPEPFQTYIDPNTVEPVNKLYLYRADVPIEHITQPDIELVEDCWITGEFWITEPQEFHKLCVYDVRRNCRIIGSPYSRWALTAEGLDEVIDRKIAAPIYADDMSAFSMLELDMKFLDIDAEQRNWGNVIFPDDVRWKDYI